MLRPVLASVRRLATKGKGAWKLRKERGRKQGREAVRAGTTYNGGGIDFNFRGQGISVPCTTRSGCWLSNCRRTYRRWRGGRGGSRSSRGRCRRSLWRQRACRMGLGSHGCSQETVVGARWAVRMPTTRGEKMKDGSILYGGGGEDQSVRV